METQKITSDVIIVGGGLIGLLQSLSLAQYGITSNIIDHSDTQVMQDLKFDGRTSAIISSSLKMLKMLNLDPEILGKGQAIEKIIVRDGYNGPPIDFHDDETLAIVYENQNLRRALLEAVLHNEHITTFFPAKILEQNINDYGADILLDNGCMLSASLIIGADGRNSDIRNKAGIKLSQWNYDHHALVGAIRHKKPHNNIAYELFFPDGPLALLPMETNEEGLFRTSLIWSVPSSQHQAYRKLSHKIFCHELNKKTGDLIGACDLSAPLISYPLGFHSAADITAKRTALIGDSAHRVHPIAGQGLNLGFRDVAALTEILVEGVRLGLDCGDAQLLDRYERWRSVDNLSVSVATDSINHIYAMRGKTASNIRKLGMGLIQKSDIIKNYLTHEARGTAGELPKMLSGHAI